MEIHLLSGWMDMPPVVTVSAWERGFPGICFKSMFNLQAVHRKLKEITPQSPRLQTLIHNGIVWLRDDKGSWKVTVDEVLRKVVVPYLKWAANEGNLDSVDYEGCWKSTLESYGDGCEAKLPVVHPGIIH